MRSLDPGADGVRQAGPTGSGASSAERPRYCSRCQRPARPSPRSLQPFCETCGETLRDQAYCRVCERDWPAPVGSPCPKHEIPLDCGPPPRHPLWAAGAPTAWVTVASYEHPSQALGPQLRLDAEGIPTFLDGERMGSESAYNHATGGVRLQVPAPLQAEARVVLRQRFETPQELLDPADDLDDAWDELAGDPAEVRRSVMRLIIIVFLSLPLLRIVFDWLAFRPIR